jgi:hypothetical protein
MMITDEDQLRKLLIMHLKEREDAKFSSDNIGQTNWKEKY